MRIVCAPNPSVTDSVRRVPAVVLPLPPDIHVRDGERRGSCDVEGGFSGADGGGAACHKLLVAGG